MTDDPGFLSRWSRRKLTPPEPQDDAAAPPVDSEPAAETTADDDRDDAEILEELGLRDPDEMVQGDDFSVFLNAQVPERLRRRALRRLWRSNPVLANLDGLNDYDTDFTGDTVPLGQLRTAYQVGRGFTRAVARVDESAGTEETQVATASAEDEPVAAQPAEPDDQPSTVENGDDSTPFDVTDNEAPTRIVRRRMAFRDPNS